MSSTTFYNWSIYTTKYIFPFLRISDLYNYQNVCKIDNTHSIFLKEYIQEKFEYKYKVLFEKIKEIYYKRLNGKNNEESYKQII